MLNSLKDIPHTDFDRHLCANKMIQEVDEGAINPLHAIALVKHLKLIVEAVEESIKPQVITEIEKYGKGEKPTAYGFEITTQNKRTYKYEGCNDSYLNQLKVNADLAAQKLKDRQGMLQKLTQKMFDSENGGFEVMPPVVSINTFPVLKEVKSNTVGKTKIDDGLGF